MGEVEELVGGVVRAVNVEYEPVVDALPITCSLNRSQSAIWASSQISSEISCGYNESFLVSIQGQLEVDVLVSALNAITLLHPAVRAKFSGDGAQTIIPTDSNFTVDTCSWLDLPVSERDHKWALLQSSYVNTPYNLENGPLFRAAVVSFALDHYKLLIGAHHIICDGWSLDVLLDDVAKIYNAMLGEGVFPRPGRPSLVEFIEFTETKAYRSLRKKNADYWKAEYNDIGVLSESSNIFESNQNIATATVSDQKVIDGDRLALVKSFSQKKGFSLFTVIFASFAILIHRCFRLERFVICMPVARHIDAGMELSVGNFVNLVPVLCDFEGERSFYDLCRQMHNRILDCRENATLDVEDIIDLLQPQGESISNAFKFARCVPVHKYSEDELKFGSAVVDYMAVPKASDPYGINLNLLQSQDSISLFGSISAGKYTQEWITERLFELGNILVNGCSQPSSSLLGLDVTQVSNNLFKRPGRLPHTDVEVKLEEMFSSRLDLLNLDVEDSFFDRGGSPALAAELMLDVNSVLGVNLSVPDLIANPTVAALGMLVERSGGHAKNLVIALNKAEGKPLLFFVYGIAIYGGLVKNLGDSYRCFGVLISEDDVFINRSDSDNNMSLSELASHYVKAILGHSPNGPYTLAGLSFGGILAFEVARQLQALGKAVQGLIILDTVLPHGKIKDNQLRMEIVKNKVSKLGVRYIFSRLKNKIGSYQSAVSERVLKNEQLWAVIKGRAVSDFFDAKPTFDGVSLILKAEDRSDSEGYRFTYAIGWEGILLGPVVVSDIPGGHLAIVSHLKSAKLIKQFIPSHL